MAKPARLKGNPVLCPVCKAKLSRVAAAVQAHLAERHNMRATLADVHRLIAPKGFRGTPYSEGIRKDPREFSGGLPSLGKRR
jgi:hypothetical protein